MDKMQREEVLFSPNQEEERSSCMFLHFYQTYDSFKIQTFFSKPLNEGTSDPKEPFCNWLKSVICWVLPEVNIRVVFSRSLWRRGLWRRVVVFRRSLCWRTTHGALSSSPFSTTTSGRCTRRPRPRSGPLRRYWRLAYAVQTYIHMKYHCSCPWSSDENWFNTSAVRKRGPIDCCRLEHNYHHRRRQPTIFTMFFLQIISQSHLLHLVCFPQIS